VTGERCDFSFADWYLNLVVLRGAREKEKADNQKVDDQKVDDRKTDKGRREMQSSDWEMQSCNSA